MGLTEQKNRPGAELNALHSSDGAIGVPKASHVKEKLIEMLHLNETFYSCGLACASNVWQTKSGNYMVDTLLANVCKQNVTRFPYEIARLVEDIAGGTKLQ